MSECIGCGSEGSFWFFRYKDKQGSELMYHYCDYCGIFWKTIGEVVLDDSITYEFLDEDWLVFSIEDLISTAMYKDDSDINGILLDIVNNKMADYFHRCLFCNEIISGVTNIDGYYECKQCGFEWGVMEIG